MGYIKIYSEDDWLAAKSLESDTYTIKTRDGEKKFVDDVTHLNYTEPFRLKKAFVDLDEHDED